MNKNIDLSIILPAYSEGENLKEVLPRINKVCKQLLIDFEILVIDTQTPLDDSKSICGKHHAIYLNRSCDNSYGSAVRTGISNARGKRTLFMDADGSHPPEFIENLVNEDASLDIVIASRYIEGGSTDNKKHLVLMSKLLNITISLLLGIQCKDISNSFKLYNTELLKKVHLTSDNFDIIEELLYKITINNKTIQVKEIPFNFQQRRHGKTKRNLPLFIASYLTTLIKLRLFTRH
jgi:dolichol-phosphate mannosyltransferase